MRTHKLKTWPEYFSQLRRGEKTFELRANDREFRVGDILVLQEWTPEKQTYTGAQEERVVTHILYGGMFDLPPHMCIMSIQHIIEDFE
jgi:hypothetical protein